MLGPFRQAFLFNLHTLKCLALIRFTTQTSANQNFENFTCQLLYNYKNCESSELDLFTFVLRVDCTGSTASFLAYCFFLRRILYVQKSISENIITTQPLVFVMNGCRSASADVHRLSGFKERQRSSRSTNEFNSLISPSFIPLTLAINLDLRSRVGLEKLMIRTTSFSKD